MDSLPDELVVQILKDYLTPRDLVTCRLVSKRFKFLTENYVNLKELLVNPPWCLYYLRRIDLPDVSSEQVNYKNWIEIPRLSLSQCSSFQILFANLKALELFLIRKSIGCETRQEYRERFLVSRSTLDALNRLVKLERLVLTFETFETNDRNLPTFTMPNLKTFSLSLLESDDLDENGDRRCGRLWARPAKEVRLTKVCSKIEKLYLDCSRFFKRRVRLKYPCKLRYLQTSKMKCLDNDLSTFKTLRTLKFDIDFRSNSRGTYPWPDNLLQVLPKLREIFLVYYYLSDNEVNVRAFVSGLFVQKSTFQRPEVKIYLNDILLTKPIGENENFARKWRTPTRQNHLAELQIQHYRSLVEGRSVDCKTIEYEGLVAVLEDQMENFQRDGVLNEYQIPSWFFEQFPIIQLITVKEIANESRFIWFVKQCRNLNYLQFKTCCLTQSILDLLPKLGEHFRCLEIVGKEDGSGQDSLDYGPVFRIAQLATLYFEMHFDLQIVPKLFRERSSLEIFCCDHHNIRVRFYRFSSESFSITYFPVRGDHNGWRVEKIRAKSEDLINVISSILENY